MTLRMYAGYVGFAGAVLAYLLTITAISMLAHVLVAGVVLLLTFPFILPVSARILAWGERVPS